MEIPKGVRNLTGQTFGHLTVLEYIGNNKHRMAVWKCRCDCGNEVQLIRGNIVTGNTVSCGCHKLDNVITHGYKGTPTYACWNSMKQRCLNPNNDEYPNYGGRGITVSEEWKKFENFLADMGEKPPKMSIDRKDNNKGYCKENCRWIPMDEQQRNMRRNVRIEYHGENLCLAEWARKLGIKRGTIRSRHRAGLMIHEILSTAPLDPKRHKK